MTPKVAHLTSLHSAFDNRIFLRECRSLAHAGYRVVLVAPHARDEVVDGVTIRAVPLPRNRMDRLLRQGYRVFRAALAEKADVYHFHDPDLLPWALLLRCVTGRSVVYDVHEDYVTALAHKPYLPTWLGGLVGHAYGWLERLTGHAFEIVIAERYYARRFPNATPVLNYPEEGVLDRLLAHRRSWPAGSEIRLLYTGTVAVSRGALLMAELAGRLPEGGSVTLIGACSPELEQMMRRACAQPGRLTVEAGKGQVPFSEIVAAYRRPWTAALALFPDSPHTREKELTKFFEYMAAGLPIVCSDFPVWRELVGQTGAGLCVDPSDPAAALAAALTLARDPDLARSMGEAGRRAARSRYSWASQARQLLRLYGRVAPLDLPPAAAPQAA